MSTDELPDTPAASDLIVYLVDAINTRLAARVEAHRLTPPRGSSRTRIKAAQAVLRAGQGIPHKLLHALELTGDAAAGAAAVVPGPAYGAVGASPAATAAWLGPGADGDSPARRYLTHVTRRNGGLAPVASPIATFERAWVLANLLRARMSITIPAALIRDLQMALGSSGAATGEGLPCDADTTSVVLYVLARTGHHQAPDALRGFDTGTHFCTWPGEDGFSPTTNAHVLEALSAHTTATGHALHHDAVAERIRSVLCRAQLLDGSWHDRWHASPYYATTTCATALHHHRDPASRQAVRRARAWTLKTQQADGGWGHSETTPEETAYALQLLATTAPVPPNTPRDALARGLAYLTSLSGLSTHPPLWHDKDLYAPQAIIHSTLLTARYLANHTQ